jgi:hypothetical protein
MCCVDHSLCLLLSCCCQWLLLLLLLQAERILQLYPEAERVGLQSGHCPHDDTPEEANQALLSWLGRVCKA